jgi:hypothetical protein
VIPLIGSTCAFTFTLRFSSLNGVYRVKAETTFKDAIKDGIQFTDTLYTQAGLSAADYANDVASYAHDQVCILESVVDKTILLTVPESIILGVPDPTIREYHSLMLVAALGPIANTQMVLPLLAQITDIIQATLGVTDPVRITANPDAKVYLTENQYAALQATRNANIRALAPLTVQIQTLQAQLTQATAKNAAYEALLAKQATSS